MVTQSYLIGLEAVRIIRKTRNLYVDFVIQNLSVNNVYFGDSSGVSVQTGLRIAPNGTFDHKSWQNDIYLIADVADSDVRASLQEYEMRDRTDP